MTYAAPAQALAAPIQNWRTPRHIFDELNREFGFDLDLFADQDNALVDRHFSETNSAFKREWKARYPAFGNPPYARGYVAEAVHKAEHEVRVARNLPCVVLLLPLTTTKWFSHAIRNFEVHLFEGRISFVRPGPNGVGVVQAGSNFSNCLVIVRPEEDDLRGVTALRSAKTGAITHDFCG